ncbi:MAG TPA: hypothetical protein VGM97_19765 [Steroidobacteraceae bacterium]|jgi:hypothetical protein
MNRTLLSSILISVIAACAGSATAQDKEGFESPPDQTPAASLSAGQIQGDGFHLQDPVHSDGLMHHYIVESRFGEFPAYGQAALTVRLHEIAALQTLSRTSETDVVLKSVTRGAGEDVQTVAKVVRNPVKTVIGIPRGISHLLGGYRVEAQEATHGAAAAIGGSHSQSVTGSRVAEQTEKFAKQYADHYLGLSTAERRWYEKLGIDPYTNNEVLRKAVSRLAKIDASVSLGMRFAPVGVPFAGEARRALDTIYNESPAVLRKRRRDALASFGLRPEEIAKFENTLLLNPTRQTLLVAAVQSLQGVEGRDELLRHAIGVTSDSEIEVFLQCTNLLVRFHARQPVARILAGLRVPTAQLADGRVIVFGSFDAIYWTEDVAGYEKALDTATSKMPRREVWLAGSVSALAREQLEHLGWIVHDHADQALPEKPAD